VLLLMPMQQLHFSAAVAAAGASGRRLVGLEQLQQQEQLQL